MQEEVSQMSQISIIGLKCIFYFLQYVSHYRCKIELVHNSPPICQHNLFHSSNICFLFKQIPCHHAVNNFFFRIHLLDFTMMLSSTKWRWRRSSYKLMIIIFFPSWLRLKSAKRHRVSGKIRSNKFICLL